MSVEPASFNDTSWEGIYASKAYLASTSATPELREHYKQELLVMDPTMRALGLATPHWDSHKSVLVDTAGPPPIVSGFNKYAVVQPPVLDNLPDHPPPKKTYVPGTGNNGFSTSPTFGPLSEADGKQLAVDVARQLMVDFGLTKEQAAGVVGNLYHESAGMNPNVNEFGSDPGSPTYGPPNHTQFGYGWAQWTGTRKDDYLAFCETAGPNGTRLDPSSPAANYAFLKHELLTTESATIPALKAAGTPEDAAVIFRKVFERAANPVDGKRTAAAEDIYAALA